MREGDLWKRKGMRINPNDLNLGSENAAFNPVQVDDTQANRSVVTAVIGNMVEGQVGTLEKIKIRKAVDMVFDMPITDRSMSAVVRALETIEAEEIHEHQRMLSQVLQKWITGVTNTDH